MGTEVEAIQGSIVQTAIALALREADVIFACTDTHWSRAILNQYADQYLTPVIDLGSRIDAQDGTIMAAHGRVYVVRPGQPCLWCFEAIRAAAVTEETLPAAERAKLAAEGYVRGLHVRDPSVISLNTVVAGLAITEFLNLMTGFMARAGQQPQLTYHMLNNTVTSGIYRQDPLCDCATGRIRALGDRATLPCRADPMS